MKKQTALVALSIIFTLSFANMSPPINNDSCPMCGRDWQGNYMGNVEIPDELPAPENKKWIKSLAKVLNEEKLSRAQYEKDSKKYNNTRIYKMVIPQENTHITWIKSLFDSYELSIPEQTLEIKKTASIKDAYKLSAKMESKLIPQYEWLIKNAPDDSSVHVLDKILMQTRMHLMMFKHGNRMNNMMRGR